jgi:putative oxidoreductase
VFDSFCKEKLGPLVLRLALGSFCVYHGFLKIMAAGGTAWYPSLPVAWQLLLAWVEFAAGLAILFGFRCRLAAVLILLLTSGTLLWFYGWHLLRLPWQNLEQPMLLLLSTLALLFLGAGDLSFDARGGAKPSAARRTK